jgi:hypothetical protein
MRRSPSIIGLLLSLLVIPACGEDPLANPGTPSATDTALLVILTNATTKARVGGATVQAQGKICTSEFITGSCLIERVPLTTISITVTHSDYVELKRDVVLQIGLLNTATFELQPK